MKEAQYQLHAEMEHKHWWFVARRHIVRQLIRACAPSQTFKTLLDVGCGTGWNVAEFANEYACCGLDHSEHAIALAKKNHPGVHFVCDAREETLTKLASESDLCLCMDVLEHVDDDFAFFSNFVSPMKVGSQILITVPADPTLWSEHDKSFGHYRRYTVKRLKRLWQGAPVSVRLCSPYNAYLYPIVKIVRSMTQKRGEVGGQSGTDFHLPHPMINLALSKVFSSEIRILERWIDRHPLKMFPRGVSLIALLRRESGEFERRSKPKNIEPDIWDPLSA